MTSWKCAQCSLINRDSDQACRRCGAGANLNEGFASAHPDWESGAPSYGLAQNRHAAVSGLPNVWGEPAPGADSATAPVAGLWREGSLLVMHKSAALPDRCLKCNAPAGGRRIARTFRGIDTTLGFLRYIPYLRYIYWVARAASDQTAQISLTVCPTHHSHATTLATAASMIRLAGLAILVYGLFSGSLLWLAGLFLAVFGAGLAGANLIVKLRRMDDDYLWLSGAHPNYLASLPRI